MSKKYTQIVRVMPKSNTTQVSPKDIDIVQMLADGDRSREIGPKLRISPRTVESRLEKMKAEIGCRTLPELVATFFRQSLIQ